MAPEESAWVAALKRPRPDVPKEEVGRGYELLQPEGDSPVLFDRLFGILIDMRADTHPLDITNSADSPRVARVTLMALTDKDGERRISEKFLSFILPEDLKNPEKGAEIFRGAHDVDTTQLSVEDDAVVVRTRTMAQARDPETDLPVEGRFVGPEDFRTLQGEERLTNLLWMANRIIALSVSDR